MNNFLVRLIPIGIAIILLLTSCNSEPSLQQYIVDSQDRDEFVTTTIPKGILGLDVSNMSATSQKAYNSIDKVNVLYYPVDKQNTAAFEKERATLSSILKNGDFKTLMTHKSDGVNMKFLYDGSDDSIDELIVYGASPEMGLGVARVLGDDMNLGAIMKMLEEIKNVNMDQSMAMDILKDMGIDIGKDGKVDEQAVKEIMASRGIDTTEVEIDLNPKE